WIRVVMGVGEYRPFARRLPRGAIDIMQIMPETRSVLGRRYHLGDDPYDAHDNIIAGTGYLRELYESYGAPCFQPRTQVRCAAKTISGAANGCHWRRETSLSGLRPLPVAMPSTIRSRTRRAPVHRLARRSFQRLRSTRRRTTERHRICRPCAPRTARL